MLQREYTLVIDRSGSMAKRDMSGGLSRWRVAEEVAQAVAAKIEQYDPNGIDLYLFNGSFRRFPGVTSDKVSEIFQEYEPMGTTNLAGALEDAFAQHFRRSGGDAAQETIVVLTDGEPDDQKAVMRTIICAANRIAQDEELAVLMIQVGSDAGARRFLKALDDDLTRAGAKFDICDTKTMDELEQISLKEVLLQAITD